MNKKKYTTTISKELKEKLIDETSHIAGDITVLKIRVKGEMGLTNELYRKFTQTLNKLEDLRDAVDALEVK